MAYAPVNVIDWLGLWLAVLPCEVGDLCTLVLSFCPVVWGLASSHF